MEVFVPTSIPSVGNFMVFAIQRRSYTSNFKKDEQVDHRTIDCAKVIKIRLSSEQVIDPVSDRLEDTMMANNPLTEMHLFGIIRNNKESHNILQLFAGGRSILIDDRRNGYVVQEEPTKVWDEIMVIYRIHAIEA